MSDVVNDLGAKIIAINSARLGMERADVLRDQHFSDSCGATTRLCVYGRMRPGGPDHHHLDKIDGQWSEISFPGFLQAKACNLDECPGLIWSPKGDWNEGFLFEADALSDQWHVLDGNEGDDLVRILSPVKLGDHPLVANVYASKDATVAQLLMLDGMNVHDDVD